jgi:hypothetical protein
MDMPYAKSISKLTTPAPALLPTLVFDLLMTACMG